MAGAPTRNSARWSALLFLLAFGLLLSGVLALGAGYDNLQEDWWKLSLCSYGVVLGLYAVRRSKIAAEQLSYTERHGSAEVPQRLRAEIASDANRTVGRAVALLFAMAGVGLGIVGAVILASSGPLTHSGVGAALHGLGYAIGWAALVVGIVVALAAGATLFAIRGSRRSGNADR